MSCRFYQVTIGTLVATLVSAVRVSAQDLDYTHTAFIHGFGSGSAMWTTPYPELSNQSTKNYLANRVLLKYVWMPNWDTATVFDTEWQNVRDTLAAKAGKHVFVTHSLGGLVTRYAYMAGGSATQSHTAAILTVAAPHQGAILADSAQQMGAFMIDFRNRVNDAATYLKYTLGILISTILYALLGNTGGAAGLMSLLFINFPSVPDASQLLTVATLPAIRTTSSVVATLNNSGNFDASVPRANIIARLDNNKFMPLKLAAAFRNEPEQDLINTFQKGRSAFNVCKNVGAFTIIGIPAAFKCSAAERVMGRLDQMWQRYSSGSRRSRNATTSGV